MLVEHVVLSHLQHLEDVQRFLEGGPRPTLPSPENCLFGRWVEERGKDRYGQEPWFDEMVEHHKTFHTLLEEVVRLYERGEFEKAAKRMDEAYTLFARAGYAFLNMGLE